jgi:hypothetical protein|tara:strand:+ start:9 stop:602 length:594 start_codon:yes stop_codon:yes gene_type:complete
MGRRRTFRKLKINIMKNLVLTIIFLSSIFPIVNAQEKYITKSGEINFEASVPSFEEVKATHNSVSAIIKSNGEFASLALVKGFRFKVALMEEHFNENYAESSKYPKATFKGKVMAFDITGLTTDSKEYVLIGMVNMHGVDKKIETKALIRKVGGIIFLDTQFVLKPEDFNINIPNVVSSKIAEEILISSSFELKGKL